MNRASPVDLRKALDLSHAYASAGIRFVPVPVLDDADNNEVAAMAIERLERIEKMAMEDGNE